MKKAILQPLAGILLGMATLSTALAADADDQSNIIFAEGTVHIYCLQPPNSNEEIFVEAFPNLISNLQIHANEGRVLRAHYLKELKHGIFIVVGGDTRDEAVANGTQLIEEQTAIFDTAAESVGAQNDADVSENTCRLLEVGPVAILPQ